MPTLEDVREVELHLIDAPTLIIHEKEDPLTRNQSSIEAAHGWVW